MTPDQSTTAKTTESDAFLAMLRASTLPAHKNLESLPISEAIISPELTIPIYTRYLSLMSEIIMDVEKNIFPIVADIIPDLEDRRKGLMIDADLKHLGTTNIDNSFSLIKDNPELNTAFAMGIMYVIEGSTLGGRVILKNLEKVLGQNAIQAVQYFSGYGSQTGPRWKSFLDIFTSYATTNKDKQEEIIAGADHTFSAIYNHLQKNA